MHASVSVTQRHPWPQITWSYGAARPSMARQIGEPMPEPTWRSVGPTLGSSGFAEILRRPTALGRLRDGQRTVARRGSTPGSAGSLAKRPLCRPTSIFQAAPDGIWRVAGLLRNPSRALRSIGSGSSHCCIGLKTPAVVTRWPKTSSSARRRQPSTAAAGRGFCLIRTPNRSSLWHPPQSSPGAARFARGPRRMVPARLFANPFENAPRRLLRMRAV